MKKLLILALALLLLLALVACGSTETATGGNTTDNGTTVDVGHSGVAFGNNTYNGGACFGNAQNVIYYSKATAEAEGNHEVHKVRIDNGAVDTDSVICEGSMCLIRPLYLESGEVAVTVGHYNDTNPDQDENWNHFTHWQMKPKFIPA